MLGIAASFCNITKTPKTSGDDPRWLRRRATSHDYTRFTPPPPPDGPRSPTFTHRRSPYMYYVVLKGQCDRGLTIHVAHNCWLEQYTLLRAPPPPPPIVSA